MRTWVLRIRAVDRHIFAALASGSKTLETRAGSAGPRGYRAVQPGDTLLFLCGPDRLRRQVMRVAWYPSVTALLAGEDALGIMPWAADRTAITQIYAGFRDYPARIAAHGIVALELALSVDT